MFVGLVGVGWRAKAIDGYKDGMNWRCGIALV